MNLDVEELPKLVAEVTEAAPKGAHAATILQIAEEVCRHDLTPAEAWDREVGR